MKQEVGKIVVVARPSIMEGMEDVEEEEDGLACMVCREGYSLRPGDALGVYSYTKRVSLGGATRGDCVYTTVSHFNVIHFQCHHEAKRADAALKNPKKEWDGAALRNNETLCNSVFPIKGPALPSTQYARYLDQHWENLAVLGRADGSRLRLLSYDIVLVRKLTFLLFSLSLSCFCYSSLGFSFSLLSCKDLNFCRLSISSPARFCFPCLPLSFSLSLQVFALIYLFLWSSLTVPHPLFLYFLSRFPLSWSLSRTDWCTCISVLIFLVLSLSQILFLYMSLR